MAKIEVLDTVTTWGYAGKIFRPGIYEVNREDILEAARESEHIRIISDDGDRGDDVQFSDRYYDGMGPVPNLVPATVDLLERTPNERVRCPHEGCTVATKPENILLHLEKIHESSIDDYQVEAPIEKTEKCPDCEEGMIVEDGDVRGCDTCEGSGQITVEVLASEEEDSPEPEPTSAGAFTTADLGKSVS